MLLPALKLRDMEASAIIIGEQDEGKTAILRMIGLAQATGILEATDASEPLRIPVFLRAHKVLRKSDLLDATVSALTEAGAERRAETVRQSGSLADYLLLLDGFSELPDEGAKATLVEVVNVTAETRETTVIVTGRPDDFLQPRYFDALQQFTIQSFDQRQVKTLVRNWTKDLVKWEDVAERLVGRVREALQLPGREPDPGDHWRDAL